jgi:hypothetical protein
MIHQAKSAPFKTEGRSAELLGFLYRFLVRPCQQYCFYSLLHHRAGLFRPQALHQNDSYTILDERFVSVWCPLYFEHLWRKSRIHGALRQEAAHQLAVQVYFHIIPGRVG